MREVALYAPALFLLLWLVIAIGWGVFSCILLRENSKLTSNIPTLPTLHYFLIRIATLQKRMLQLWAMMSVLLLITSGVTFLAMFMVKNQPSSIKIETVPAQPIAARHPAETKPAEPQPVTSNVPSTNSLPYSDITEFDEKDSKQQAMLDWLKQRYENWLITYYYLQKCNLAGNDDFDFIRRSLRKELSTLKIDTTNVEDNIFLAANGSYNELYASASCSDERLKATKSSYDNYMGSFRTPAPAATNPTLQGTPDAGHP